MSKEHIYFTGLITIGDERDQPKPPFNGAGWVSHFARQKRNPPLAYKGKEIIIQAKSWYAAQRGLDLITGCHQLIQGDTPVFPANLMAHNKNEPEWMDIDERLALKERTFIMAGFPLACAVAARASRRRRWVYAIAKFKFSQTLIATHSIDMQPFMSPHHCISSFPYDHVMFSHAIIAAYAAIEDLGLEMRASKEKPSRIHGKWNPVVKTDLEQRLTRAGINLEENSLWIARGTRNKIEKKRSVSIERQASWAWGNIRDSKVQVVDAIAYADWLRDCIAAHAYKSPNESLSPYAVCNVQSLTRRLLLESLGYWRHSESNSA